MFQSSINANVRSLGAYLDATLSMKAMINEQAKSCHFNLRKIGRIRNCLNTADRLLLVKAFILNKLDYCNILLSTVPVSYLKPLQKVLNYAMRFAYCLKKRTSVSSYLKESHILPIVFRIKFKCCVTVYQILNNLSPTYLNDFVQIRFPSEFSLRSNMDTLQLTEPSNRKSIQYALSKHWNELPFNIRSSINVTTFKSCLKTHYFDLAY